MASAPVAMAKVSPIVITGGTFFLVKKAPHPNAARLLVEWIFSPPGRKVFEKVIGNGAAEPGSGTQLSKLLEGSSLVYRDEKVLEMVNETGIIPKIQAALGIGE